MSEPLCVPCPQCGKKSEFSPTNPTRPFCSERCRLIDLGEWASEGYAISTKEESPDLRENDEE